MAMRPPLNFPVSPLHGLASEGLPYSNMLHSFEGGRSEACRITPGQRERWVLGARILACVHDTIHVEGPAAFVLDCLDKKLKGHTDASSIFQCLIRYILSFVFIIAIPVASPYFYVSMVMQPTWGYMPEGVHNHFVLSNAVVDMPELRAALANASVTEAPAVFLTDQIFQSKLVDPHFKQGLGAASLFFVFAFVALRAACRNWLMGKQFFIMSVLNSLWHDYTYPLLKFSDVSLFGGYVVLYKWVPCAWLATVCSLAIGVPLAVAVLDGNPVHALKCLPVAGVAGYATGKVYLQLCHTTFAYWLSSSKAQTAVVKILFESHMRGLFKKLLQSTSTDVFALTLQHMEHIAASETMERLLWKYGGHDLDLMSTAEAAALTQASGSAGAMEAELSKYLNTCSLGALYVVDLEAKLKVHIDIVEKQVFNR